MSTMRNIAGILIMNLLFAAGLSQAQNQDIRFVDMDRLFNQFYKTELAQAQLQEQAAQATQERDELVSEYEALQEGFEAAREEAQNQALSEEVRNTKRNEAEEKLLELREFENRIRKFDESRKSDLDAQSKRMRVRIVEEIREEMDDFARNLGLAAIIDVSGQTLNGIPVILYYDPGLDITVRVLELINQGKTPSSQSGE